MQYKRLMATLSISLSPLFLSACDMDVTKEGELPDVDVSGGRLPEVEVEAADVDVERKKVEVVVPDVDINMPDENAAAEDRQEGQVPPPSAPTTPQP